MLKRTKNSSGDEIANVNFFYDDTLNHGCTSVTKYDRLTNDRHTDGRQHPSERER